MELARFFFYLFLVSLPFGTRVLVYQFTTGFHEYEAVFLYASDVFLSLFLAAFWIFNPTPSKKRGSFAPAAKALSVLGAILRPSKLRLSDLSAGRQVLFSGVWLKPKSLLIIFLVLAGLSIVWSWNEGLAIYNFGRLALLVLLALAVVKILKEGLIKLENIFAIIVGSAVLQSLIGFLQFLKQSSLGLGFLGESVLGPFIGGTAKIIVEGAPIMRAYGTFPHPNVLAAFLLLGLLSSYYLYLKYRHPMSIVGIFIILLGLVLTFSRTAWLIAILLSFLVLGSRFLVKSHRKQAMVLSAILFSIFCFLVFSLSSFILSRAQIAADEPSVSYRLAYNQLGLDLIKANPLGIGIGNQVLYSVKNGHTNSAPSPDGFGNTNAPTRITENFYEKFGMDQVWQWQPIHNIYLLIASEIGVFGLLAFLIFLITLLFGIWDLPPRYHTASLAFGGGFGISQVMLITLLGFGLADHFLWTLQPGRLMLWLVIGILMSISRAHSTMDSVYPSEG